MYLNTTAGSSGTITTCLSIERNINYAYKNIP